ncbi:hypothetical protein BJ875DRAFT_174258 [Amylocarpus encephaloides]|uniref:Uncharacterized protein n=1 Tax=Amylocarpus encephaloides TaxID=45428 RepID=A0A9P7Y9M2_9HELO|nr:hypothetical protein BJ875DRAFT_174258 [Amylocarpus encephaloides]
MTEVVELNKHRRSVFLDDMRMFHGDSSGAAPGLEMPRGMSTSTALLREDMGVEMEMEMHGEGDGDIYDDDSNNSIDTCHEAGGKMETCSALTTEKERAIVMEADIKIEQILQEQDDFFDWTILGIGASDPERATALRGLQTVANGRAPIYLHKQDTPHKRRVLKIKFTRDGEERRIWTFDQQLKKSFISGANRYAIARRFLKRCPDEEEETSGSAEETSTPPPSKRCRVVPPRIEDKLIASLNKPTDEKSDSEGANEETIDTPRLTPAWALRFLSSPPLQANKKSVHWVDDPVDKTKVDQKNSVRPLKGRRFSLPRNVCLYTEAKGKLIQTPTSMADELIITQENRSRCCLLPPMLPTAKLPAKRKRRDSGYEGIANTMDINHDIVPSSYLARTTRASAPPPGKRSSITSPISVATTSRAITLPTSPTKNRLELPIFTIPKNRCSQRPSPSRDYGRVYEAFADGQASDFLKQPTPPNTKNVDKYLEMLRNRNRKASSERRWK